MNLPETLQEALRHENKNYPSAHLKKASQDLTTQYRKGLGSGLIEKSKIHRTAYLNVRLPPIFSVLMQILKEIGEKAPELDIRSTLDLGAGPGTASWACSQVFSSLDKMTLLETSSSFVEVGKRLALHAEGPLKKATWVKGSLEKLNFDPHDLVILSFVANELSKKDLNDVIDRAWESTQKCLLIVGPGTPDSFERLRSIRSRLIDQGANLLGPCPHNKPCPIQGTDWCHFSVRVQRNKLHRFLKEGSLGYEDEKFMYILLTKEKFPPIQSRILRHPARHTGHVILKLCQEDGNIQETTIPKSQKKYYQKAKKSSWGDVWPK